MVVERRTFIPKHGKNDELVELIKKAATFMPFAVPYRLYTPQFGRFDEVVLEMEFKDLAEIDRYWVGWLEKVSQAWWDNWFSLTENGGEAQVFQLVAKV